MDLKRSLYATKKRDIKLHPEATIGMVGDVVASCSKARGLLRTGSGAPKLSLASILFDKLLIDYSINVATGDNVVYVQTQDGSQGCYLPSENLLKWDLPPDELSSRQDIILLPIIAYIFHKDYPTTECLDIFIEAKKGNSTLSELIKFCDSFYYAFAKEQQDIKIETLSSHEVSALFRNGLTVPEQLKDLPLPELMIKELKEKTKKAKPKFDEKAFLKNAQKGKYHIPYEWREDQLDKIETPNFLNQFIPLPKFYSVCRQIKRKMDRVLERIDAGAEGVDAIGNDYINMTFSGNPGTGKTTWAHALSSVFNVPVYTTPIEKRSDEDTFQGMTKVIDGKLTNVMTNFSQAFKYGGIIVLEEINLGDAGALMGVLGQAVEFPFILMKDGYKEIKRHPLCIIISTKNTGTNGSKDMSQALSNRFKYSVIIDDPKKDDFINILVSKGHDKIPSEWVYDAYMKIITYLKSPKINAEDIALSLSMRTCLGALDAMADGDNPIEAIENTFLGKISESDLEIATLAKKDVINILPNLNYDFGLDELEF